MNDEMPWDQAILKNIEREMIEVFYLDKFIY